MDDQLTDFTVECKGLFSSMDEWFMFLLWIEGMVCNRIALKDDSNDLIA